VDWGWVDILTEYLGASPEDVELNVTNKIEDALQGISGIKDVYSLSVENVSNVYVQIVPDTRDTDKVKNNIRDAVGRITDFPDEVTESPYIEEDTTATNSILAVGVAGDMSYGELREVARGLGKKLEAVPGVARLARIGYRAREIKVEVKPHAMEANQVSLHEIMQAIGQRNIRLTGGTLESYTSEKNLVTLAQFTDPVEMGDVIVRSSFEGPLIKIRDLAVVRDDFEEEKLIARVGGHNAILFGVFKSEDADIIRTVTAIRRMLAEESGMQHGDTPVHRGVSGLIELFWGFFGHRDTVDELPYEGATVYFSDDISKHVENSFRIVVKNGIIGLVLVLIILTVFLNLRTAFWVALGIPVSIMGTCFLLPLFDSFLDTVTLTVMVIVIGIIVDDGVIISESIFQHRARGENPVQAAVNGTHEVFLPVVTTVLTTFLAFVPVFTMSGDIGKVVWVVPLTIGLALFFSLAGALFALPSHLVRGMEKRAGGVNGAQRSSVRAWFDRLRKGYYVILRRMLRYRYILVALFIAAFTFLLWHAVRNMDFILFPSKGAERFYLNVELPRESSLEATVDRIEEVEKIIAGLPDYELESYMGYVGRTEWGTTENSGFIGARLLTGGEAEESRAAVMNIATGFVLAAVGIYFLLVLLFKSFTQPFIVLFAVPFGLMGVIIAFMLHGEQPSFLGMMGVIGMSGIVVNDSLVLVSHINNHRLGSSKEPITDLIARGKSDRLRAIVLTSITTVAGLLPLTYGIGGSDIYMSPLALVMGYGILFAMPLTLVLVPCLYAIGADIAHVFGRKQTVIVEREQLRGDLRTLW
jgi:multidrug efflux pump subunit AcrB